MTEKGPCAVSTNVSKPEKHGRRNAVVDYLVTTSFDTGGDASLVRRTFEDFLWVQKRLVKERMGIIVPVLSEKKPAKVKDQLVEPFLTMRQESLDRFMQRVIHHPELVDAPCLFPFFTANPTDWIATKEASNSVADKDLLLKENTTNEDEADFSAVDTINIDAQAAMLSSTEEVKKGPMRKWFANKRTEWALKKDNLNLEETPAETKKFADMKTYADHLEVCVRILNEDFQTIQASNTVLSAKTGTMGAAFAQMWGEHDLSNTSSSNLYQSLGNMWAISSKRIQSQVAFRERHFEGPIEDLLMDVVALQDALAQRKAVCYEFTKLTQEGKTLNKQLDRIRQRGNMAAQQERYFKLESQLRHLDEMTAESRNHNDLVTTRLERDIDRFRVDWHERMRQVLQTFHKQQMDFLKSQTKDLSSVLPALANVEAKRSDLAIGAPQAEKLGLNFSVDSNGAKASVVGANPGTVDMPTSAPPLPPPTSAPPSPPPLPPTEDPPEQPLEQGLETISLNTSFSSDDGFDAKSAAMGGATQTTTPTNEPIVRSV